MNTQANSTSLIQEKSTNVRSFYKEGPAWIASAFAAGSRVAPGLTASVAARLFMTTRRAKPKGGERDILETARAFRVGDIAAWSWGEGPVVLLVHGWNGRATQMGGFVQPLVERGYQVVAFDALGHGESPGHRSSLPEMAGYIRTVADSIGEVHGLIAHSMGGAASTVALADGLDIARAVFISPPSNPETFIGYFSRAIGLSDEVRHRTVQNVEARVGRVISELRADTLAPGMSVPLLVIHDEDDHQVPIQFGQEVAAAWPGAEFVATQGLGHRRILRAETVTDLAVDFIDAQGHVVPVAA